MTGLRGGGHGLQMVAGRRSHGRVAVAAVVVLAVLSAVNTLGLLAAVPLAAWPASRPQRPSALLARRAESGGGAAAKPRVVFLGSPACVCVVLQTLADAASEGPAPFDLCGVVTQPPKYARKGMTKTPIHELAEELGIQQIWIPQKAKDKDFLAELEAAKPDVCITAAYGQYLPKRFLRAPRLGTLNLHPSLLPRWRGASPVQRALVAGDEETGITILYTVTKMDAGPIALQQSMSLQGHETSTGLLDHLFCVGSKLLVGKILPKVFSGELTMKTATPQDEKLVTLAPLISKTEGLLWPHNETAKEMLNKIRGFDTWPGTTLPLALSGSAAPPLGFRVIVSNASIASAADVLPDGAEGRPAEELVFLESEDAVAVMSAVDPDSVLLLRSFQMPGKKKVPAPTFHKGYMVTQPARWLRPEEEQELAEKAKAPKKKKKRTRGG